jgi:hypothetical protein
MNGTEPPDQGISFPKDKLASATPGHPMDTRAPDTHGGHPDIFPQKRRLDDMLVDWPVLVAKKLEPFFDEVAATLPTHEFYKESKRLDCWPVLVRAAALGVWRANHKTMPKTMGDVVMALDIEHFIEILKREGREAFSDYEERVALLERVGFREEAKRARIAAKNARRNMAPGVPRSCSTSSALRENLAMAWLTYGLWALADGEIASALPRMRKNDGSLLCSYWQKSFWGPAGRYETGSEAAEQARKAVSRMRIKLGLVSSRDLCGVECGRWADGIVMKAGGERWQRIMAARGTDIK